MYDLKCTEKFDQELPITDVFSRCQSISNTNKMNIIIIKNQFRDPTFRYRGYNIVQTMENNEKYNVNYFLDTELKFIYELLDKIDLVIIQRSIWTFELESFMNMIKNFNIPVLYDVDDLIYNTKYVPKYINNIGDYRHNVVTDLFAAVSRYELIASRCDGFIVTTKDLAENVKKDFNKPVWIFHNYLNLEQEKVSEKIVKLKENSFSDDKFIIGYFSGSYSHKRDLEIAEPALLKLFKKYDNIYLKIVGYMDLSSELNEFKKKGRITISGYVPYEELQYEIGQVDLNIVPLQKHEFNNCKSELKYFEASIVNTLTLATDNVVYQNCIVDGFDGFLTDELSWFEKMEYIYLNHSKLNDIVDNARIKCLKKYSSKEQEKMLQEMYDDIFKTFKND